MRHFFSLLHLVGAPEGARRVCGSAGFSLYENDLTFSVGFYLVAAVSEARLITVTPGDDACRGGETTPAEATSLLLHPGAPYTRQDGRFLHGRRPIAPEVAGALLGAVRNDRVSLRLRTEAGAMEGRVREVVAPPAREDGRGTEPQPRPKPLAPR